MTPWTRSASSLQATQRFTVAPGNYQVTLAASPLLATGDVYDTSQTANLDVSPTASQDEGRQATAPAEQSVTLELATKDSATVTDDDINSAIAYAKQASDDTSVDYSYDDDIVKAVTASPSREARCDSIR